MVIFSSVLQICGAAPYLVYYCLSYLFVTSKELDYYGIVAGGIIFLANGSKIFIYFACNNRFRQTLTNYFRKLLFLV